MAFYTVPLAATSPPRRPSVYIYTDEQPGHHPGDRGGWWRLKRVTGSHHPFAHPTKPGLVTVIHPAKDIKLGTLESIEKQSGVTLRK